MHATTPHIPADLVDLDTAVEFLRPTGYPISRVTLWRWVRGGKKGLHDYGDRRIMVSLSEVLDAHGRDHYA
jgi:hypothetical protein